MLTWNPNLQLQDQAMPNTTTNRLPVLKTYKIYVGGQFPRTESGRYYAAVNKAGKKLANICLCSRKDLRDAVSAARAAQAGWSGRSAFNRSQILYRMAEMLEGRRAQFMEELQQMDYSVAASESEINESIDLLIYFAGWCDKYQQLFSSVNPVGSPHFNFSVPEPMGVVSMVTPQESALLGLVSMMAPVIAGGNTCVLLASEKLPLAAISFAEVLHSSDLPGGVVNILTGKESELLPWMADHMDINALLYAGEDKAQRKMQTEKSAGNLKRLHFYTAANWKGKGAESPYRIMDCQEIKTTWHPIETIAGSGSGY
jgi:acyl-CoA reductase-like NAD-dependent aldehyde dehydrogenase